MTQLYTSQNSSTLCACVEQRERVCFVVENNRRKSLGCIQNTDKGYSGMELTRQLSDGRMFYFLPSTKLLYYRLVDKTTSAAVNKSDLFREKK